MATTTTHAFLLRMQMPASLGSSCRGSKPQSIIIHGPRARSHSPVSFSWSNKASSSTLRRPQGLRQSSSHIPASTQEAPPELTQQLKEKLIAQLEATDGYISDEAIQTVTELAKLNPNPDYTAVPELYTGAFQGIKVSFKGTGRPGERGKKVESRGTPLTLGRLTFNSFQPAGLEVLMDQVYNHVGLRGTDEYSLITEFQVTSQGEDAQGVQGLSIFKGRFTAAGPTRMDLVFDSITLAPRVPDTDLELWKSLFREGNPGMDDRGVVPVKFPAAIPGFVEFLYLDDELRVTKGNQGNINVVRRLPEPLVTLP